MNLADIKALVAVVESGSLAHAAVELGLTQPAVTRRIQRLEEALQVTLLDRDMKPARLTADGRRAYAECIRVMNAAQDLKSAFGGDTDSARPLRLGISAGAADLVLAALLAEPGTAGRLTFEIDNSAEIERAIKERRFDAGLVFRDQSRSSADERLATLPVAIVTQTDSPLPARATLQELHGRRWVLCPGGCGFRRALEHSMYGASQPLDVGAALWGFEQQAALVAAGVVDLGLLPLRLLERSPHAPKLRVLKVPDFSAALDLCLIRPASSGTADTRIAPLRAALARILDEPWAAAS